MRQKNEKIKGILVIGGIIALIVVLRFIPLVKPRQSQTKLPPQLDQCMEHGGSVSMHIHPRLSIMIDGQAQLIPANIGVEPFCMRPVHTHDEPGVIHLEFPNQRDVPLGDFFTIWGKRFDRSCVLDTCVGAGPSAGSALRSDSGQAGSPRPGSRPEGEARSQGAAGQAGQGKTLKLRVNGKDNTEFERYIMRDKDRIEIIVE